MILVLGWALELALGVVAVGGAILFMIKHPASGMKLLGLAPPAIFVVGKLGWHEELVALLSGWLGITSGEHGWYVAIEIAAAALGVMMAFWGESARTSWRLKNVVEKITADEKAIRESARGPYH